MERECGGIMIVQSYLPAAVRGGPNGVGWNGVIMGEIKVKVPNLLKI